MTAAAFSASYADFKIVKGRKCAQIVLEVPIEAANAALDALGGVPRSDQETWVGVARIDPKAAKTKAADTVSQSKERKRWNELLPAQQAALRCKDEAFRRFVAEEHRGFGDEESTAEFVRAYCSVGSRSEIKMGTSAAGKWLVLDNEFVAWLHV